MATETRHASTTDVEEYEYLERRPHRWRKQLYLKGRNMTVDHLITDMRANGITAEAAVANYDLPLAQIQEALAYYARHRDVVEADAREEIRRLQTRGIQIDAQPLSG